MPERLAQRGERLDPLLAAVLAAQLVLVEGELRVALGQLAQPALVAALGDPDLDRRAARARSAPRRARSVRSRSVGPDDRPSAGSTATRRVVLER